MPTSLQPEAQIDRFYAFGVLAECNDVMAQMYGFARAAELGWNSSGRSIAPFRSTKPRVPASVYPVRLSSRLMQSFTNYGKDGSDRFFLNNLIGIVSDGHLVRAWGSQRDITAKK